MESEEGGDLSLSGTEKASSTGVEKNPLQGHWQISIETATWAKADLRQGTLQEQVQGSTR